MTSPTVRFVAPMPLLAIGAGRGKRRRAPDAGAVALTDRLTRLAGVPLGSRRRTRRFRLSMRLRRAESDRELLMLVAWEGLEPSEIAELLGVRPGTVAVRLQAGARRLATALSGSDPTVAALQEGHVHDG